MRWVPRAPGSYLIASALWAILSYLAVQLLFTWELDLAGALRSSYRPADTLPRLFTDHLLSLAVWLALALGAALVVPGTFGRRHPATEDTDVLRKAKADFVSVVSHEFRTPLTAIQGFSEMIRDENFSPEEIKEFAVEINTAARRLDGLIGGILDLERLESGQTTLVRKSVDLNTVIADAADLLRAGAPGHSITLRLDPSIPPISVDPERLGQVMVNLLDNAIKGSPDGGEVLVTDHLEGGEAHVEVRDHGTGIPPEALARVFERHSRVKDGFIQGIGLGLPLVRRIVQSHGGRIWAESTPGQGSVFHFTIPLGERQITSGG